MQFSYILNPYLKLEYYYYIYDPGGNESKVQIENIKMHG